MTVEAGIVSKTVVRDPGTVVTTVVTLPDKVIMLVKV